MENPITTNFAKALDGYSSNRSENRNLMVKNRPFSASTSKRNGSQKPKKEDEPFSMLLN